MIKQICQGNSVEKEKEGFSQEIVLDQLDI
jgi:hypothetical protein